MFELTSFLTTLLRTSPAPLYSGLPRREIKCKEKEGGGGFRFLTINIFHVLQSRLGDVHGHRGDRGDQAGEHGRYEVAEDAVLEYIGG